jgi:multiple sugar transport system substrate-binding protein
MKARNRLAAVALGTLVAVGGVGVTGAVASTGRSTPHSKVVLTGKAHGVTLTLMYGSSGPAETAAVTAAAKAWAALSGNKVNVINASNFTQQLDQAFAGGTPPDVFYLGSQQLETFAKQGELLPYASLVAPAKDFYPALVKAYTWNHTWYCIPKDFSNLALEINTTLWKKAGLTSADIPKNWSMLEADAKKLTGNGVVGLDVGNTLDRLGAFFAENGGSYMNAAHTAFTFNSPQNVKALQFVQSMAKQGILAFPPQQSSGWAGEAFGLGKAAMTTEGNWIIGAMKSSYPSIKWAAYPMPAGPTGKKGTLTFTNCWGIPSSSKNSAAAVSFVKYLASPAQQLRFAEAFGVLPSRISVAQAYAKQNPQVAAFVAGTPYAMSPVGTVGFATVQSQFDSQVANLASLDPKTLLDELQQNAEALLRP